MKNFASTTGTRVALAAAAMSVICALFVPYGYPWPSLAWAILACAAAMTVAMKAIQPSPSMNDVISHVDAEPARASVASARRPR
jgi:hypothetical protein